MADVATAIEWDDETFERVLERLSTGGTIDAAGVRISPERLASILQAARRDPDHEGRPMFRDADFSGATFEGDAHFDGAQFSGYARFGGAQFSGYARFVGAQFSGDAWFTRAQFSGEASFGGTQFSGDASFGGARFFGYARFNRAQFYGEARFVGAQFSGDALFGRAQFSGYARFGQAQFSGDALFGRAQFSGDAWFDGAQISGDAWFDGAQFSRNAGFGGAQFSGETIFGGARFSRAASFGGARFSGGARFGGARFGGAQFSGDAQFGQAQFSGDASFDGARFSGDAQFGQAQFSGDASFDGARFSGEASFRGAAFRRRARLAPVVARTLFFDQTVFDEEVQLNAAAGRLSCRGTRFGGRADLNVRWAEVALDEATFAGRSRLAGAGPFPNIDESQARDFRVDRNLDAQARPRVLSLRQANVENLAVANVDLRACRFFGAHGLDQLRVEPDCDFAEPPPRWWYTRRRTLAEEHHWHARSSLEDAAARADAKAGLTSNPHGPHDPGCWHPPKCQPAAWLEQEAKAEILDPPQIASLYRLLRKALEDRKDEPGAADFYYGEMEMRRRRPPGRRPEGRATQDRGERVILNFYWLVSGYGLRATRAFAALLVTLVLFTALLYLFGLQADHRDLSVALLQSIEGAAFRAVDRSVLDKEGQYLQVALRILGPLFLGLALLSLRGRVRR